jgi:hypothetical protein
MLESCSSNALNGCQVCGPGLVLFQLSASTSQSKAGHARYSKYYAMLIRILNYSYFTGNQPPCTLSGESGAGNGSFSSPAIYNYDIDAFGNIAIYITGSDNASYIDTTDNPNQDPCCFAFGGSGESNTVSAGNKCNPTETTTTTNCSNYGEGNESDICPYPGINMNDCSSLDPQDCTSSSNETNETLTCSYSLECGATTQCTDSTTYSNLKDLQFFYDLCKSSVSTKIGILGLNQKQNCAGTTCGEDKDACWGVFNGSFSIADNNLDDPNATSTTSQKLKFKIGTIKEGFDKTYKTVSGKVKFYYGGTDGKTPCCNEDFDGTVVKEADYSISAGPTFKNDYLASDSGDFDNSDQGLVGETIGICYTIDNIKYF